MENASLKTLFDALPNEDHDRIEAAAYRYHFERTIIGPIQATRKCFLSFLGSFPGAIFWSDEEIAQGIDQAQQSLASLNATNNQDAIIPSQLPTHPVEHAAVMGATQTSNGIPKDYSKPDTIQPGQNSFPRQPPGIQPPAFQPSVVRPSANQSVLPPSPVEPHELVSASPQKMSQSQRQALATPSPPPSSSGTNKPKPLEIPYLGKICDICDADFVWKKTAERCFMCLENKPSHEKIAEILERAMRGLGSCSNCYKPEDRGADKHCLACHTRQVGKTQRHQAKKRAQRSQAALAALRNFEQGGGQQAGSGVAAAPSVNIPGATGAGGHQSGVGVGPHNFPGYGGVGSQNYLNFGDHGAQNYPGYGGAGAGNGGILVNKGGIVSFGGFVNAAPGPHHVATQGVDVHPGGHGVVNNGVVNGGNVYGDFTFNGDFVVNGGNVANGGNMANGSNGFPGGNQ